MTTTTTTTTTTIARCPWCSEPLDEPVDATAESAESFCPQCAAPLFWTPSGGPRLPAVDSTAADGATTVSHKADPTRRYPELKGVRSRASVPCWQCLEPNQQVATACHRCGATIPMPAVAVGQTSGRLQRCGTAAGGTARRRVEVKAWILVTLGVVLIGVTVRLIATVWW